MTLHKPDEDVSRRRGLALLATLALFSCAPKSDAPKALKCEVSLVVLGVAQDAGRPQIGQSEDAAWKDHSRRRLATSLAIVDRRGPAKRWLVEATPDIREQLHRLDLVAPAGSERGDKAPHTGEPAGPLLDGVFVTHAHIGHYAGLMFFGQESAATQNLLVYVMPGMAQFLAANGPWSQLAALDNIGFSVMRADGAETIAEGLTVTPFAVPHREEFSEVVGFGIEGPRGKAVFIPDIDRWEDLDAAGVRIEDEIARADIAFLDGTFYSADELPGRDMSQIPHPPVLRSMERFAPLAEAERAKIRFIHMNHTNPLLDAKSPAGAAIAKAGMGVAEEGEEVCL